MNINQRLPSRSTIAILGLLLAILAGCGGVPSVAPPVAPPVARPLPKQTFQVALGDGIVLDYEVEYKISGINNKSCYAFFSGTLQNGSTQTLGRKAVLDFIVTSGGQRLFRNITNPVADIPPGRRAMFEFFSSPMHREGCPVYERIDVSLRRPPAN